MILTWTEPTSEAEARILSLNGLKSISVTFPFWVQISGWFWLWRPKSVVLLTVIGPPAPFLDVAIHLKTKIKFKHWVYEPKKIVKILVRSLPKFCSLPKKREHYRNRNLKLVSIKIKDFLGTKFCWKIQPFILQERK